MRARSGLRKTSPSPGALPLGAQVCIALAVSSTPEPGAREGGEVSLDVVTDDLWDRSAGFGEVDRGFEELGPLQFAVALVERPPGIERTGGGDGDRSQGREDSVFGA